MGSFSENVQEIFEKDTVIGLAQSDLLPQVLQHFAKVDLHPDTVPNGQTGDIFGELIRKVAEVSDETAGEHLPRRQRTA